MGKYYGGYSSSSKPVSELRSPKGTSVANKVAGLTSPDQKDYRRALRIDFRVIADAQEFYGSRGFLDTEVPWVVGSEAYEETKPDGALAYSTLGGFLVGSAEQSFLQLLLRGKELGKAQATTPCFRDEAHDEIHSPYFMKTELINTNEVTQRSLDEMIQSALEFFNRYLPSELEDQGDGTWDIVSTSSKLELGSYGIRTHGDLSWVYGTGVALPRLTQALSL